MAMPRPAPRVAPATRAILPCSTLFGSCFGARVIPIHPRHMIANMRAFRAWNWNVAGREREINYPIRGTNDPIRGQKQRTEVSVLHELGWGNLASTLN